MDPHWRQIIEREYGVLVYSTYAATETGRIGFECEHRDGYHLNLDCLVVRVIDSDGRDVAAGKDGELCISCLLNRGTVLLNYRIDDFGSLSRMTCPCGRSLPKLGTFYGKIPLVVELKSGRRIVSPVFNRTFIDVLDPVLKFQLVLAGPGRVVFRVVIPQDVPAAQLERSIRDVARRQFGDDVEVSLETQEYLPAGPGGKFSQVVQKPACPTQEFSQAEASDKLV